MESGAARGRITWSWVAAFLVAGGASAQPSAVQQAAPGLAHTIQLRVEAGRATGVWYAAGHRLRAAAALPVFYERRAFESVWTFGPEARNRTAALRSAIRASARHGLDPSDYHQAAIDSLAVAARADGASSGTLADLELLATDAFMTLGSHLLMGRVNPETIDPEWLANRRQARFEDVLAEAVATGRIAEMLEQRAPPQPRYRRMQGALRRLRAADAAGGWPRVDPGEKLEQGAEGPRVVQLRERLIATGELARDRAASTRFDAELAEAVRTFQARHGLEADGIVGAGTLAALDVSPGERARQIEVNLERWRWLPNDLGERHLEVNIAGFDVTVVENERTVRTHRTIVGRQYRQTPMFSGSMTYLVLAPYWHVPPTIAAVDKLPSIKADPGYLAAQRMTLLDQATNTVVQPGSVDWANLGGAEFNRRYRLRQDPGPRNALGAIKFMFPNRYSVYLHDTPDRQLFARASRSFSSGCIRTENPLDLAAYLLQDQPEWTRERIDRVAAGGVEQSVRLSRPVPVHLLYWTAWADERGTIHYREDIYGRDVTVRRALEAPAP